MFSSPRRIAGSEYANGFIGRLGSGLISEPDHYSKLLSQLVKDNPEAFNTRKFRRLPTSIETLEVNADVLKALLAMPPRPGVKFHSIIGARSPGPPTGTTDGVVTYQSTHLDGVESELLVASDHSVPKSRAAINEVRRILLEHLAVMGQPAPAVAVQPGPAVAAQPVVVPNVAYEDSAARPLGAGTTTVTPSASPAVAPAIQPSAVPRPGQVAPAAPVFNRPDLTPPTSPGASPLDNLPPLVPPATAVP